MAELDLGIVYGPGKKNVVADVLLRYEVDGVVKATARAWYSLGNSSVRRVAYEWLNVVANHLTSMLVLQLLLKHFCDSCHLLLVLHISKFELFENP